MINYIAREFFAAIGLAGTIVVCVFWAISEGWL